MECLCERNEWLKNLDGIWWGKDQNVDFVLFLYDKKYVCVNATPTKIWTSSSNTAIMIYTEEMTIRLLLVFSIQCPK